MLAESPVAVLQILLCLGKTVKGCLKPRIFEGFYEIVGDPAVQQGADDIRIVC